MTRPSFSLPRPLSDALDRVMVGDRDWFLAHPELRWRVRSVEPAELRSNELVQLFTDGGGCSGCSNCAPYVLVIRWPSGHARVRHFFAGDPFLPPEQIYPGAVPMLEASTDEEFLEAFRLQVRPLGRRRTA